MIYKSLQYIELSLQNLTFIQVINIIYMYFRKKGVKICGITDKFLKYY